MSKKRHVRCFDYVNHGYESVRDALGEHAVEVFASATAAAATRAESVAATLRVDLVGLAVGTDIKISVKKIEEGRSKRAPVTRLQFDWEAAKMPRLFPFMRADLAIYPLTKTETQLDLSGDYEPPLGALGSALDAAVGHRIAEASVHSFVSDLADYLRRTLEG